MQYDAMLWFVVLLISAVIEGVTAGLFSIWFVVGAVVAMISSFFHVPMVYQVLIFLAVSLVMMYFIRPLVQKFLITKVTNTNADRVVGQRGIVVQDILPGKQQTGQVKVLGQIWTALSEDGSDLSKDTDIIVQKISGVKLIVMPAGKEED